MVANAIPAICKCVSRIIGLAVPAIRIAGWDSSYSWPPIITNKVTPQLVGILGACFRTATGLTISSTTINVHFISIPHTVIAVTWPLTANIPMLVSGISRKRLPYFPVIG